MPVFNEERAIRGAVLEWLTELRRLQIDFRFLVLNDGSTDGTLQEVSGLSGGEPELEVLDKPNTGHADSCMRGYRQAIENGDLWILQIDSDGQCDPKYFAEVWRQRDEKIAVQGFRVSREDGFIRLLMSRVLSVCLYLASGGTYVRDLNVPYRLMHRSTLKQAVVLVPERFPLSNILLSYIYEKYFGIRWVDINFRDRWFGSSKTNLPKTAQIAIQFFDEFSKVKPQIEAQRRAAAIEQQQRQE